MTPLISVHAVDIPLEGLALDVELPAPWLDRALGDGESNERPHPRALRPVAPDAAELTLGQKTRADVGVPGRVAVRLSRSGKDVVVRGRVHADVEVPCVRCLEPTPVAVEAELSLLLHPALRAPRANDSERGVHGAHGGAHGAHGAHGGAHAGRDRPSERSRERVAAHGVPRERPSSRTSAARRPARGRDPHSADEYEFSADEADTDRYNGETVVLDDFVRECILLEIPTFPLCSESCPGMASAPRLAVAPAPERPVDPRLAPLGALRDRFEDRESGSGLAEAPTPARPTARAVHGRKPMLRSTVREPAGGPGRKRKKK